VSSPIEALVADALAGEENAWRELVDRVSPIIWSVCRSYRFAEADTADVAQTVFIRLVENLGKIREPAALPGWIQTTARRECSQLFAERSRQGPALDVERLEATQASITRELDEELLEAERRSALREAFAGLPDHCQRLLRLLMDDKPLPYKEISAQLGRSVGGIGPTRARCIEMLKSAAVLRPWTDARANT